MRGSNAKARVSVAERTASAKLLHRHGGKNYTVLAQWGGQQESSYRVSTTAFILQPSFSR